MAFHFKDFLEIYRILKARFIVVSVLFVVTHLSPQQMASFCFLPSTFRGTFTSLDKRSSKLSTSTLWGKKLNKKLQNAVECFFMLAQRQPWCFCYSIGVFFIILKQVIFQQKVDVSKHPGAQGHARTSHQIETNTSSLML